MSTDRKAIAESHLARAAEWGASLPLGSPEQVAHLAAAQANATLYAAEQQRIANLIQWTTAADFDNEPDATQLAIILDGLGLS